MAYSMEIERRFIVDGRTDKPWRDGFDSNQIRQYYIPYDSFTVLENRLLFDGLILAELNSEENEIISNSESFTSRIRITQDKCTLTLKGKRNHASAIELEWEIESSLAENIAASNDFPYVEKIRCLSRVTNVEYITNTDVRVIECDVLIGLILSCYFVLIQHSL